MMSFFFTPGAADGRPFCTILQARRRVARNQAAAKSTRLFSSSGRRDVIRIAHVKLGGQPLLINRDL
jgi:hypothetical protein